MPDLKLGTNGDILVASGAASLTVDATGETTAQYVKTRLRLFRGEWFLDNRDGVDYFGVVFVKNPDMAAIQGVVKARILSTTGVAALLSYSQAPNRLSRRLDINCNIKDNLGNVVSITGGI